MKFSIIIPVYKVEKYLRECVDSVLCQSFRDYEIILVDDGSPDLCPQMCDDYAAQDTRVKVIHQTNAGIACARNVGTSAARGEYLIFIDSDDYLLDKDILHSIASKTVNGADIVLFGYKKYFESDSSWGVDVCPTLKLGQTVGETINEMLLNGSYIATAWTKAIRRTFIEENNILFKPGMISGEDVDWYLNILCFVKKFESVNKPCVAYRQRPDSISHKPKLQSLLDFMWILETWPKRIEDNTNDNSLKQALMSTMGYYWANTMILYSSYSCVDVSSYKKDLVKLSVLKKFAITKRALSIRFIYNLLGFNLTIILLKLIGKIKKSQ